MAKARFDCADCGASISVFGSNRRKADSNAAWHANQGHVCEDCQAKRYAAEAEKNAAANAAAALPALTGSPKQIAWAETLRADALARFERIIGDDLKRPDGDASLLALSVVWRRQTAARWWIDTRDLDVFSVASALEAEILAEISPPGPPPPVEVDAQSEALLKPETPVSDQVAEISYISPTVRVAFPEKNETFRLAMRDMGFSWNKISHVWMRTMDVRSGAPLDRQAEVAHRLLAAGFMVRLHDDAARAKALSGDFVQEQTRWVSKLVAGEYAGWFRISWDREDDLYGPARRILGSRYHKPDVVAPPTSAEEVADFAGRYGFSISDGASEIIAARRADLAAGVVIDAPKGKPKPIKDVARTRPAKIETPDAVVVSDALRDA